LRHLKEVVYKLKALKRIDITRKSTVLTKKLLLEGWIQGSGNHNFKVAVKEFVVLRCALKQAPCSVRHLSHGELLVTFFGLNTKILGQLVTPIGTP
jgi:hypothetical protein